MPNQTQAMILPQVPITLPIELITQVYGFLWGTRDSWKHKLNIIEHLPSNVLLTLQDVSTYRLRQETIDSEDCLYCRKCGEKTLWFPFSFRTPFCEMCDKWM